MFRALALFLALLTGSAHAFMGMTPVPSDSGLTQETRLYNSQTTTGMSFNQQFVVDVAVRALIAGSIWQKLDFLYLTAAAQRQTGRINLKRPGTFTATEVDTANLSFSSCLGFTNVASNAYLDTGYNPTTSGVTYTEAEAHMAVYTLTDPGANTARLASRSAANTLNARLNNSTSFSNPITDGLGYSVINRTTAALVESTRNTSSVATSTTSTTGLPNVNYGVLNASTGASNRQVGIAHLGGALSGGDISTLYSTWQTYLVSCTSP